MKASEFNELLDRRLARTKDVLASKATEYASDQDRLHNFKAGAAVMRCTQAQAVLAYMTKHIVSIVDMVASDAYNDELIDEKIGDCINYLCLLEAVMREENQ